MIFVTVGASQYQFDRLLRAVDAIEGEDELVVQHGPSSVRPRGARCVAFLPFEQLKEEAARARIVVSHGGIGSILVALAAGKRPIVVPRLARFGETTDDHQLDATRRLAEAELVTAVLDPLELPQAVSAASGRLTASPGIGGGLVDELRGYIDDCVALGRRQGRRSRRMSA